MLTNKNYCDYDTSCALVELGFNGFTQGVYKDKNKLVLQSAWLDARRAKVLGLIIAPHLYSAQKWLREEKDIIVYPEKNSFGWYCAIHNNIGKVHQFKYSEKYNTYEEALLEGIKEAVKILKGE